MKNDTRSNEGYQAEHRSQEYHMSPLQLMTMAEHIGYQITVKRKIMRLSQRDLAERIGSSQTSIGRIELGHGNPTLNLIQRIVNELELTGHVIIRPDADQSPEPAWIAKERANPS